MFAGSPECGQRAATIYSLVCTCGLLGIEPWAYLKDVLQRIAEGQDPALLTPGCGGPPGAAPDTS